MNRKILVIGGGASGLMAAIQAASAGASVTILEHNDKPGKKLLASGNGKCNLTNRIIDPEAYHSDAPERVRGILERFTPEDTIRWFEQIGLRVFDRQGWVYPCTEQASSVLDLLLWEAERFGVRCKNREDVVSVERTEDNHAFRVRTGSWEYTADSVILSCGSPASSVRGASDFAIQAADALGIMRYAYRPVLVPLQVSDASLGMWNGTRIHAAVRLYLNGVPYAEETGEVQLTSYGISGIPVFQLSRPVSDALQEHKPLCLVLDLLPEIAEDEMEDLWNSREFHDRNRTFSQLLTGLIPDRLIPVVLSVSGVKGNVRPNLCDHEEGGAVSRLLQTLRAFPVEIRNTAQMEQAQVCRGGICASELTETLSSRSVPGLYATGEAVNVDGPCGGYNLQWAWSSGYTAGQAAAKGV